MNLRLATLWLVVPVVGAVIGAIAKPLAPHDFWWHLAMGRAIADGLWPASNLFLYTLPADLPFVNQPWLGQLMMWFAYDVGGVGANIVLRSLLVVATVGLLLWTALRRGAAPQFAGGFGLLTVLLALPVLAVRTRMFALVPLVAVVALCQAVVDGRWRPRALWWLVPITAFWANTHGSFALAVVLVGAFGVGDLLQAALKRDVQRDRVVMWGLALLGVVVGSCLTPYGPGAFGYVLQLTAESTVADTVTEWQPPDITELHGGLVLATCVFGTVALAIRRRAITITDALLWGGTMVLAADAVRAVFAWSVMVTLVVAPALSRPIPSPPATRAEKGFVAAVLAVLLSATLLVQPGIALDAIFSASPPAHVRQSGEGAWMMHNVNAFAAIDRVRQDQRHRVFHDQAIGGMLEVLLTREPAQVAFVDQRMEFIPEDVWDRYFGLSDANDRWERELARWEVDTMILLTSRQQRLVQAALLSPEWELVMADEAHLLFYRSLDRAQHPAEEGDAEGEEREVHHDHGAHPAPRGVDVAGEDVLRDHDGHDD